MSNLSRTVRDELVRYFRHLAARVERAARATPPDQFWVKPLSFGNSVGHLLLHMTGNLNHYLGSLVAGTGYVRDRPLEFTDPAGYAPDEVLERFKDAIEMVVRTVESQDDADLMTAVKAQDPIETRFGLLLVCAAHLNNHIGQLAYLVQAHGRSTNEPPIW